MTGEFDVDHFQHQSLRPDLAADYENLVYSCRRCNGVKSDAAVADPTFVMCRGRIVTGDDGRVSGVDAEATWLIFALDLNSPRLVEWRITWMRIVDLAA
ncbi:MAG TPA: HNH endonuclease, partial [Pirellulales bacterium]|nr:HNH endonuclease [Pirellulales bacterium]